MRQAIGLLAYGLAFLLIFYSAIVFRLLNPELTETQLFLDTWPQYVIAIILLAAGAHLFKDRRRLVRRRIGRRA